MRATYPEARTRRLARRGDSRASSDRPAPIQARRGRSRPVRGIESRAMTDDDREAFVAAYGPLFEHSPWVAEHAYATRAVRRPATALLDGLTEAIFAAPQGAPGRARARPSRPRRQGRDRRHLTPDSRREQASAGLDRLTPEEYEAFTAANAAYRERFGLPFVICVRDHDKASILAAAEARLRNDSRRSCARRSARSPASPITAWRRCPSEDLLRQAARPAAARGRARGRRPRRARLRGRASRCWARTSPPPTSRATTRPSWPPTR